MHDRKETNLMPAAFVFLSLCYILHKQFPEFILDRNFGSMNKINIYQKRPLQLTQDIIQFWNFTLHTVFHTYQKIFAQASHFNGR
jgi:hypothetical protein